MVVDTPAADNIAVGMPAGEADMPVAEVDTLAAVDIAAVGMLVAVDLDTVPVGQKQR